jgi:hypothetical protein
MNVQEVAALRAEVEKLETARDALAFWRRNEEALCKGGCHLILSSVDGAWYQQPVLKLGPSGRLFSAFSGNRLFFLDESVTLQTREFGTARLGVDYDILFDTNAASLLRRLAEGRHGELLDDLRGFLQAQGGHINWNHWLYLNENRAAVKRGERLEDVFATVLASEQLAELDLLHFSSTGEWRLRGSPAECVKRTQTYLAEWHRTELNHQQEIPIDFIDDIFGCAVLKMTLLQLEAPSPRQAHRKFARFLKFLHEELIGISVEQAWCAWHLFSSSSIGEKFFRKIQAGTPNLATLCSNMTMDLCHWHWFQTFTSLRGRQDAFLLPYLLTFDQGLGNLLSGLQWRSALVLGTGQPMPIYNFDLKHFYKASCGGELDLESIFSREAVQFRESQRALGNRDYSSLRRELTRMLPSYP